MAKALIMGRSIVLGENVAQAKVAPLSSAAAAKTDAAAASDGACCPLVTPTPLLWAHVGQCPSHRSHNLFGIHKVRKKNPHHLLLANVGQI